MSTNVDQMTGAHWSVRRPVVFAVLGFTGGCLAYLMIWGSDTTLNNNLAFIFGGIFATTLTGYLGFASLDLRGLLMANRPQAPVYNMQAYAYPQQPDLSAPLDDRPR